MARNYEFMMTQANNMLQWLPEEIKGRYTATNEDVYGHLFVRHFERDSKYLRQRCLEKRGDATAFFVHGKKGRALLCRNIVETLLDEQNLEDIAYWLVDPSDSAMLEIEMSSKTPIGHGYAYVNGEAKHQVTSTTLIILQKSQSKRFIIKTVYPKL